MDLPLLVGGGAAAIGLALPSMQPVQCKICGADDGLDVVVRNALRLRNPTAAYVARRSSDAIGIALPIGALTMSAISAHDDGSWLRFRDDTIVLAQAITFAQVLTGLTKDTTARSRPDPHDTHQVGSRNASFYSGHTSFAFTVATSAATIATIRDRPYAPWMWAVGETMATGVAYLRVAGDAHWFSDVAVGAVVGSAVGFAVPWFMHRVRMHPGLDIRPTPGGLALVW